jgi:hypothetical protein
VDGIKFLDLIEFQKKKNYENKKGLLKWEDCELCGYDMARMSSTDQSCVVTELRVVQPVVEAGQQHEDQAVSK